MNGILLHWWAWPKQIFVNPIVCPVSPEGQRQTAQAVVQAADWQSAYGVAVAITAVIAILAVLITFETRSVGDRFRGRWWKALGLLTVLSTAAVFAWLSQVSVQTSGCEYGMSQTSIPNSYALLRASVTLLQAPVFFIAATAILVLVAKITKRPTWYNNSRFWSLFHLA